MSPTWQSADGAVRLFCADAREILPTLPDESVGFVFTDPPYGLDKPILNDGMEPANELLRDVLPEFRRLLPRGGCAGICCAGGGGRSPQFAHWALWIDDVMHFKQAVVWDKGVMGVGWHYRRSYEMILVAEKKGQRCRWFDTSHRVENVIRPGGRIKRVAPRPGGHPTPKPPELAEHFLQLHSQPGDLVLDAFMGHASTAIACIRTGRRFVGIELDPEHFQKSVERIEAELANSSHALAA